MSPEENRKTRLQKLSGSEFEIADGEPDIRGWDVKDAAGRQLGEVEELIFDYQSQKVRYLVVDLEENDYGLDDRDVLVPIGIAELHESDDDVILTGVTADQLRALPEYVEERFDTEHETGVRNVFGGLGAAAEAGGSSQDDFYNHDHFNEGNLYRNRRGAGADQGDASRRSRPRTALRCGHVPVIRKDFINTETGEARVLRLFLFRYKGYCIACHVLHGFAFTPAFVPRLLRGQRFSPFC
ncbi:MAG: hypothetical protein JWP69_1220 [Flaviaesturariibacter sp.]|nr:hypothetical protein [Flaviaesturariibacter sp.]